MADVATAPATRRPAPTPAANRGLGGSRAVRLLLRFLAVGYVLALVALPVLTVTRRTFENGLGPVLEALQNPDFVSAARLGVQVALASVLINTVFGVGISYLLVRFRFPGRRLLNAVIDLPVSISPVVVGIALILVYGRDGWIGSWLEPNGFKIIFATPAIVLATVIVALPLVVREVVPVLEEAGTDQHHAARDQQDTQERRVGLAGVERQAGELVGGDEHQRAEQQAEEADCDAQRIATHPTEHTHHRDVPPPPGATTRRNQGGQMVKRETGMRRDGRASLV